MASDEQILDTWDKKIHSDRLGMMYSGCYFKFEDENGVLAEGSDDPTGSNADVGPDTPCILTSCSKVFAGTAVMRTMHLRPDEWYPEKGMHEFEGWEEWKDFPVYDNVATSDGIPGWSGTCAPKVTVHNLLTHTSGWPFGLQGTRARIKQMPLYFEPGTNFGYSIGHRILGWMLLDYWQNSPENEEFHFENLDDVFNFLIYEPLNITNTYFIQDKFEGAHSVMGMYFSMKYFDNPSNEGDDDPADLAMASSGNDMMKLGMMALRRGRLPDGSSYIDKWDEWAATNQLPNNKLSKALSHWKLESFDDINFLWRTLVTRTVNAGPFGWSYFGATYHGCAGDCEGDAGPVVAVGWKGFSSCGVRADYEQNVALAVMQECVPDPGNRNFGECIHEGKCGDFKIGEVARKLAEIDDRVAEQKRVNYPKKDKCCGCVSCCSHKVMTAAPQGCLSGCFQCFIGCGYKCGLPLGVRVLRFHKNEALAKKAGVQGVR